MVYAEITWIFVVATIGVVFVAFGIGANDVANSFGTSVGAGALTMKKALALASVCEFGGAVLMGAGVTDTIRGQIADVNAFVEKPDVLSYGLLCSMMASGTWLIMATCWEIPVSTTHSIVGAMVGMAMVASGPDAVNWSQRTSTFPFLGGVSSIALSWVFSPILTGLLSLCLFVALRSLVLRSPHAYRRAYYVLPVFVFLTFFMISMFVIQQGGNRFQWDHTPLGTAAWISACVGAGSTALAVAVQYLVIHKKVAADLKREEAAAAARALAAAALAEVELGNPNPGARLEGCADDLISDVLGGCDPLSFGFSAQHDPASTDPDSCSNLATMSLGPCLSAGTGGLAAAAAGAAAAGAPGGAAGSSPRAGSGVLPAGRELGGPHDSSAVAGTAAQLRRFRESHLWSVLSYGANFDVHEVVDTDERIGAIHYHSERFDWRAESVFKYLQVFTGMTNSFAHGSNDVANAVGPYAAIYFIWLHSSVEMSSTVPVWILVIGGAGIVLGLLTYGYKIMRILGVKMCRLSHSRGFVVEISAATVVFLGSRFSLPISTTHCLVGAVSGIGLLEGRRGFNWLLMLRFIAGWVATLVVTGLTSALFTAQGIYSPNNNMAGWRFKLDTYLINTTEAISAALAGSGVPGTLDQSAQLNASLAALPSPLLDATLGAQVQAQALQYYQMATTWVTCAANATAGG
ncbi:hypothetical protein ABPG75_004811 [Micractinium tetrahymenae]